VDISPGKLALAAQSGAVAIDARTSDPVAEIMRHTHGAGVDVALEMIGLPLTMRQSVHSLGVMGRAALVGLTSKGLDLRPYTELINKEAEVIGVSDHLASELPELLQFTASGKLDLSSIVTREIPLEAAAINRVLDELERFDAPARTVIKVRTGK
jgi:threonine dehydrogenase-like Zn-dependent dehydrogenase